MAANDCAVVVGINRYPNHQDLKGAQNDALKFYQWVVSSRGGAVPRKNVRLLLSLLYARQNKEGPTSLDIETVLLDLVQRKWMAGGRLGRLYLFFAGHGIDFQPPNPAILGSDGDYGDRAIQHVTGAAWAQRLLNPGLFQEVVLLMDCCRDDRAFLLQARTPPYAPQAGGAAGVLYRMHCLATRWDHRSREAEVRPGMYMGKFSKCLLDTLTGRAPCHPQTRLISGQKLRVFVEKYIGLFDTSAGGGLFTHAQRIDITGDLDKLSFRVAPYQPLETNFVIDVVRPDPLKTLDIADGEATAVGSYVMVGQHDLHLASGLYSIQVRGDDGSESFLKVSGDLCKVSGPLESAVRVSAKPA